MDLGKEFPNVLNTWNDESYSAIEKSLIQNGLSSVDLINNSVSASRPGKSLDMTTKELQQFSKFLVSEIRPTDFLQNNVISTGLKSLDTNLDGGVHPGQVTEVFGASGTGKSQLLLWLASQIKHSTESERMQECSIYISTEALMESKRLSDFTSLDGKVPDNISYIYCQDIENLDHILFTQLRAKIKKEIAYGRKVKAIFIDSIGHHLRSEDAFINTSVYLKNFLKQQEDLLYSTPGFPQLKTRLDGLCNTYLRGDSSFKNRTSKKHYLLHLYRYLSNLARSYNLAVLVSNQVSDVFSSESPGRLFTPQYDPLEFLNQIGVYSGWNLASLTLKMSKEHESEGLNTKRRKVHIIEDGYDELTSTNGELAFFQGPEKKTPALGYTWSKLVMQRILLWKTYEPEFDEKGLLWHPALQSQTQSSHLDQEPSKWKLRRFAKVVSANFLSSNHSDSTEFVIGKLEIREPIT